MEFISKLAEVKIQEAIRKEELENLPGKGKPLNLEDLSRVPEDLRVGYILLKNAGVIDPRVLKDSRGFLAIFYFFVR